MASEHFAKSISEDEVSDCISEKVDEGWDRERAVAACLSMAEEGSTEPDSIDGVEYLARLFDSGKETIQASVEDVDTTPTEEMANVASEVLEKIDDTEFDNNDCGTRTGLERANQLENQEELSADTVGRMVSFFARHDGNQTIDDDVDNKWEDCGFVAWQLWGGDPGRDWAERKQEQIEEAEEDPNKSEKQADYQFEVGDWVSWEFGDGTSQGQITDRENEPGESLSAQGNEREATEEEPVYKMDEWDEEEGELTNDVVKSESELSEISQPDEARKVDTMSSKQELKDSIETQEQKTADKHLQIEGKDVELVKQDSETEPVINIPIQALTEDRDGDIINEKGQESIIRQLKSGTVPLVPNHGVGQSEAHYGFEDIFGQFIDGENRNGTTIATARLLEGNQYADKLIELLENDMPVGFSVGFRVLEGDERKEEGGMEIEKVDLMEVSAVGIPSNPEAVPQAMGSAVAMAKNAGLDKNEIVDSIKKAFNDTMSEKQTEDGTEQNNSQDSKSEELKQMTSEDVEMAMEVISGKVSEHMGMAMDEAEDEIMGMLDEDEDEDMEEDEMEEEDEDEEMSQSDASDHTEDSKDESAESENKESETDEDLKMPENGKQGGKISEAEESSDEEKSEEEMEDPFAVRSI